MPRIEAVLRGLSPRRLATAGHRPAAVLVPFSSADGEPCLVLTRRSQLVRNHKGEIAFPGGIPEATDGSPLRTAVRETVEELGVRESDLTIWGELDSVETSTGYVLSVFTGRVENFDGTRISRREIDEVLVVPVAELFAPESARDESRLIEGRLSSRPTYSYNGHVIWGATARIIAQLAAELRELNAPRSRGEELYR